MKTLISSDEGDYIKLVEVLNGIEYEIFHTKNSPEQKVEFIVPNNCYVVFGDNRGNSNDSRYWGGEPQDAIVGKDVIVL